MQLKHGRSNSIYSLMSKIFTDLVRRVHNFIQYFNKIDSTIRDPAKNFHEFVLEKKKKELSFVEKCWNFNVYTITVHSRQVCERGSRVSTSEWKITSASLATIVIHRDMINKTRFLPDEHGAPTSARSTHELNSIFCFSSGMYYKRL